MSKLELRKYQLLYTILQNRIFERSDTFKTMTEFQSFIRGEIPGFIDTQILRINNTEVYNTERSLNIIIPEELTKMRQLCTSAVGQPDLFTFNPEVDGAKVKRRSSSNKVKRKRLSNKRRLSGRGSRHRAVISRRRR